ncbi:MAG: DNA-directed RNA polymerase subunit K [Candidatus Aenigmatarchaeota archaeon]
MDELTRFEKTRIISARALQISMGAPILVKTDLQDPKDITLLEFEKGVLPITASMREPKRLGKPVA